MPPTPQEVKAGLFPLVRPCVVSKLFSQQSAAKLLLQPSFLSQKHCGPFTAVQVLLRFSCLPAFSPSLSCPHLAVMRCVPSTPLWTHLLGARSARSPKCPCSPHILKARALYYKHSKVIIFAESQRQENFFISTAHKQEASTRAFVL